MSAERSSQKPKTNEEAFEELERCAGSQFDPEIAKLFVDKVLNE